MKLCQQRRQEACKAAQRAVYAANGEPCPAGANPFQPGTAQHRVFQREYDNTRRRYWQCEDLLDVLGGRTS